MLIKSPAARTFVGIFIALMLALIVACISLFYLNASLKVSILLAIIALLVTLWTNRALPMGVVSLLPIILFPSFEILDTKSATSNYANPIVYLFLGGFMIAAATEKIGLHRLIAKTFLSKFPKNPQGAIAALGFACVILGSALSNSTVALLLLPVAMSLSKEPFLRTRFLLAIAFAASISGITTPISSPPNLIFLGFLESLKMPAISFTTWIFMMLPLTLLMLLAMIKILAYKTKDYKLDLHEFDEVQLTSEHKRLLVFLGLLLFLLFINSPIRPFYSGLGLNENVILLAFGLRPHRYPLAGLRCTAHHRGPGCVYRTARRPDLLGGLPERHETGHPAEYRLPGAGGAAVPGYYDCPECEHPYNRRRQRRSGGCRPGVHRLEAPRSRS